MTLGNRLAGCRNEGLGDEQTTDPNLHGVEVLVGSDGFAERLQLSDTGGKIDNPLVDCESRWDLVSAGPAIEDTALVQSSEQSTDMIGLLDLASTCANHILEVVANLWNENIQKIQE